LEENLPKKLTIFIAKIPIFFSIIDVDFEEKKLIQHLNAKLENVFIF
jgi:hypothetical protein